MIKRVFDIFVALLGLCLSGGFLVIFWLLTSIDTQSNGLFIQERIGQFGEIFNIYKLKTIHPKTAKISKLGNFLRRSKIDELPQLWNVLLGTMSVVGPRPDVAGYYDLLTGEDRRILELKPGLTSPASIKYYDEEALLDSQLDPIWYNDEVIFPDKVRLNLDYYYHRSFYGDFLIVIETLIR
jgi:lipopolysaccharide/colanic/teichoic acid biosynthesis glycosyltransferase